MSYRMLRLTLSAVALMALPAATGCRSVCDLAPMASGKAPEPAGGASSGSSERPTTPPANAGSTSPQSAARAVEEADIIQVDGGRLYAMSSTSGLSIVDISVDTRLALLGSQKVAGAPFEMYRRGEVVLTMSNNALDGAGQELSTAPVLQVSQQLPNAPYAPVTSPYSAQVVAFDVHNPAAVKRVFAFEVPGEIADSRAVGDVLYVVSYESGQCFKCSSTPRTVVTSFNVSNPAQVKQVDQVAFSADKLTASPIKRSVAATSQRLYVAGIASTTWTSAAQSTIDVLDVSDPAGKIRAGAKLAIKGQILSRWQMDEHEGILRVISQRDIATSRNGTGEPQVDTFKIVSSDSITPLGSTTIKLPVQEALKAVRFDGNRAYAITFRNTDPLFTIDLSDPATPVQKGELQIPGFVHHIEPRGDRLIALGVDQNGTTGSLNVSLFDVADMANPTMLDRVSFGAYGGLQDLTEDQDRIHKAFRIFEEQGLIAVPHTSRYEAYYGLSTCTPSKGGVQLIDIGKDTLRLRALLAIPGTPRRALVEGGRLLAVSETNVRSFSLLQRDISAPMADLTIGTCSLAGMNGGYPNYPVSDSVDNPNVGRDYGKDGYGYYGGYGGGKCY